jgi:hypothetical protein
MMTKAFALALSLFALVGCTPASQGQGRREAEISDEVSRTIRDSEARSRQSRTMSSLSKLEEAVASFVKIENRIPKNLFELVPKYLAEMPPAELGVRGHRDRDTVKIYPSTVLRDGQIDGSQIKDTGGWGYVHSDNQIVIFIDCTHQSRDGKLWYQEHGVY